MTLLMMVMKENLIFQEIYHLSGDLFSRIMKRKYIVKDRGFINNHKNIRRQGKVSKMIMNSKTAIKDNKHFT